MPLIHKLDSDVLKVLKSQMLTVSMASAITEVVQNSLDAQATTVHVLIDVGKLDFTVSDNGVGMTPEDLDRLGTRNSTSKIDNLSDLAALKTYGFRGEALFCISSVSRMTVISKVKDYNRTWVRRLPGSAKMLPAKPNEDEVSSRNISLDCDTFGTTVIVQDLLYNIPVRRKIILNEPAFKTYMSLRQNLFQLLILHAETQLSVDYIDEAGKRHQLFASKQISSDMTAFQKLSHTFLHTFGSVVPIESLKRVSANFKEFSLNGIISKTAVRVKDYQLIFINGRKYHNGSFMKDLDNMFQTAGFGNDELNKTSVKSVGRPYNSHALVVIDVRCPLISDDLMQDPTKKVLSSSQADVIHPLILKVAEIFLSHQGFVPFSHIAADGVSIKSQMLKLPQLSQSRAGTVLDAKTRITRTHGRKIKGKVQKAALPEISSNIHKKEKIRSKLGNASIRDNTIAPGQRDLTTNFPDVTRRNEEQACFIDRKIDRRQLSDAEIINQVGKKFILARIWPHGRDKNPTLIIVDQHACDERIKLETYLKSFIREILDHSIQSQPVYHCKIELSATEATLFKHFEKELNSWGIYYCIELDFGEKNYLKLQSLPPVLNQKVNGDTGFLKRALQQIVEDLRYSRKPPIANKSENLTESAEWWKYISCIPVVFREIFNSRACRSAIMFGDSLSKSECSSLLKELAGCWMPFQCAHGRPSMIPLAELEEGDDFPFEERNLDYAATSQHMSHSSEL